MAAIVVENGRRRVRHRCQSLQVFVKNSVTARLQRNARNDSRRPFRARA
jgi:hypothetical protein